MSGSDAEFKWVDDITFLAEHINLGSRPFGALPMMPGRTARKISFNSDKAMASGLNYRAPEDTARDTLAWQNERIIHDRECADSHEVRGRKALDWGSDDNRNYWMAGLTREQEKQLLLEWSAKVN